MIGRRRRDAMVQEVRRDLEMVRDALNDARVKFDEDERVMVAQRTAMGRLAAVLADVEESLSDEQVDEVVGALEDASAVIAENM